MRKSHVFSAFGACLVIAFALGACDSEQVWDGSGTWNASQSCSAFTTCNTCTAANGCGWCFNADGTGFCGDDANACSTEFAWESNFCHAPADASVSTTADASSIAPPNSDASTDASNDAASEASTDADTTD